MLGKMRHRLLLQNPVVVTDQGGGRSVVWNDKETIYGQVEPLRGADRIHAQALRNPITHKMTIRYRSDVKPEWRVSYDSRFFNIHTVIDPDERKNYQILHCEEGLPTRG